MVLLFELVLLFDQFWWQVQALTQVSAKHQKLHPLDQTGDHRRVCNFRHFSSDLSETASSGLWAWEMVMKNYFDKTPFHPSEFALPLIQEQGDDGNQQLLGNCCETLQQCVNLTGRHFLKERFWKGATFASFLLSLDTVTSADARVELFIRFASIMQ